MFIGAASPINYQIQVTDTVSGSYGKLGFCGPKTFNEEGTTYAWFTVNASTGIYVLQTTDDSLQGLTTSVEVKVSLDDYPSLSKSDTL